MLAVTQLDPAISSIAFPSLPPAQAPASAPASHGGFTFHDFLSIINPLQHLPVISTIYRAITGDTIGVPEKIAVPAFTLSIGSAMYINQVLFKQIIMFFPADSVPFTGRYFKFGMIAWGISFAVIIVMLIFDLAIRKPVRTWAVSTPQANTGHVPAISYIVPAVPVLMAVLFQWPPLAGMILAIILTLVMTGKLRPWDKAQSILLRALKDGTTDGHADAFRAHYLLGRILEQLGDRQGAIGEYRFSLTLASGYRPAQDALRRLGA